MTANQFKNQYQNNNQIIPILIENGVPFYKCEESIIIWLKNTIIYLYTNDTFYICNYDINQQIQSTKQEINNKKGYIQYCKQDYIKCQNIKDIDYIFFYYYINIIEEHKMYIIKAIHLIEMAEYYEFKSI